MNFQSALELLKQHNQEHILQFWEELSKTEQEQLLLQIESLDFSLLQELFQQKDDTHTTDSSSFEPLPFTENKDIRQTYCLARAKEAFSDGKIAAMLVAGGQGSRLGFDGPKGKFNVGLPSERSIFQIHAERLLALKNEFGTCIPWLIMTSQLNHSETLAFFQENNFFGYPEEQLFFFQQGMLPALDQKGKVLLESKSSIALVPDGNGGCFAALYKSGAMDFLNKSKVEHLFVFGVDNILAPICDPLLTGFYLGTSAPSFSPVVRKAYENEKVGLFVLQNGKPNVCEYSDLPDSMRQAKTEDGNLLYAAANLAMHYFRLSDLQKIGSKGLPYHTAFKKVKYINSQGELTSPETENAFKFEQFMFDIFPPLGSMSAVEIFREGSFAPVKNKDGLDSPQTAREMYLANSSKILAERGIEANHIELSPLAPSNLDLDSLLEQKWAFQT